MKQPLPKSIWLLTPFFGCCLFILLYIIAAFFYPGGSNMDTTAKGFSIQHNYWCELLSSVAKNGEYNPGSRVAVWAMGVLCVALAVFWWLLPRLFKPNRWYRIFISFAGITSMVIAPFMSTRYHDLVLNLASIPGIIALIVTFIALYKYRWHKLLVMGACCLLLVGVNNYIYYTGHWLHTLPVVQKCTFLFVITWMCIITWVIYYKEHAPNLKE
ncbi:hypothetical protein HB364_24155 [Pseudoflavitalea sp. X16]|uniref:hypothetical protein n=1 Tax=Paraflavitalea devenefica TaxID=2716334 RepID=UPI00141DA3A4|nr:hypothetical protein [Paraflavitalea devenefica]NII28198.1 hypothetical protein [Paraflavitalea devenefica]